MVESPATIGLVSELVGAVLVGGRSGRMGRDKAGFELGGESLAGRAQRVLAPLVGELLVVGEGADLHRRQGSRAVGDRVAGGGPLAGLDAALAAADGRPVLLLACDLPAVQPAHLTRLLEARQGREAPCAAVVAVEPRGPQPLLAIYEPRCSAVVESRLRGEDRSMVGLLEALEWQPAPLPREAFCNVNSPADLGAFAAISG